MGLVAVVQTQVDEAMCFDPLHEMRQPIDEIRPQDQINARSRREGASRSNRSSNTTRGSP